MTTENEKAREAKRRSKDAFDGQAATYDEDMHGAHARALYPHVAGEVARAVEGNPAPRLLDLGCGTGPSPTWSSARSPAHPSRASTSRPICSTPRERASGGRRSSCSATRRDSPSRTARSTPCGATTPSTTTRTRSAPLSRHVGDVWQPAPARAVMNAWLPHSAEGDVRIYSEREMREILGKWFDGVSWRRVGPTACLAVARKGR